MGFVQRSFGGWSSFQVLDAVLTDKSGCKGNGSFSKPFLSIQVIGELGGGGWKILSWQWSGAFLLNLSNQEISFNIFIQQLFIQDYYQYLSSCDFHTSLSMIEYTFDGRTLSQGLLPKSGAFCLANSLFQEFNFLWVNIALFLALWAERTYL